MNANAQSLIVQARAALRGGDLGAAEHLYRRAAEADPRALEPAIDLAIVLDRQGRPGEATALLQAREADGAGLARYWSARAAAERQAGQSGSAAASYNRCLALEPAHSRALHGRARVSLERGEAQAVEDYERALAQAPGIPELWLGRAQALEAAGKTVAAREAAEKLVAALPEWDEALVLLAQLRAASGDSVTATDHFAAAAAARPGAPTIPLAWCRTLAGLERYADAAEVAGNARRRFPDDPRFALLEAVHASEAQDHARAEEIFAALAFATPDCAVHEARHRIRVGQVERAEALLEQALSALSAQDRAAAVEVNAWALLGVIWRLRDDARGEWLHEQPGLVAAFPLALSDGELDQATALLDRLHDTSAVPLGQSVRGGTQTRGALFDRAEAPLAPLREAIEQTLRDYRDKLPAIDPRHPLLRFRDEPWRIVGSWSIRLSASGFHVSHVHPQGLISSALHLRLPSPDQFDDCAGWLELGRPPANLNLDLPPLTVIEPVRGKLALFPSTLFHGTRSFSHGCRMTVAFDVATGR